MSDYGDESDDNDVICPYCQYKYQPEGEDYDEEQRQEGCDECGKSFWLAQESSVTHHTTPDCQINGIDHDWERVHLLSGRSHDFCSVCGKCRPFRDMEDEK